jgi:sorting nexin-1/2
MDTFDDLLPSRSALEENPFDDPFAKPRSGSPDPWNSWAIQHQPTSPVQDIYPTGFEESRKTTPPESPVTTDKNDLGTSNRTESVPSDPLESASQTLETDDDPSGHSSESSISQTPGFRESVAAPFDEIATIRPTVPEELEPSTPSNSYFAADNEPASSPPTHSRHASRTSVSFKKVFSSPSSSALAERNVVSPLESPAPGLDHSFASLALGGESVGGWQGSQSSWANDNAASGVHASTEDDDDDDDDKPIRRPKPVEDPTSPVSHHMIDRLSHLMNYAGACGASKNGERDCAPLRHLGRGSTKSW